MLGLSLAIVRLASNKEITTMNKRQVNHYSVVDTVDDIKQFKAILPSCMFKIRLESLTEVIDALSSVHSLLASWKRITTWRNVRLWLEQADLHELGFPKWRHEEWRDFLYKGAYCVGFKCHNGFHNSNFHHHCLWLVLNLKFMYKHSAYICLKHA